LTPNLRLDVATHKDPSAWRGPGDAL
jgi:hypothetical protein